MNIPKKAISQGFLAYIGVQVCVAGVGLINYYSKPQPSFYTTRAEHPQYSVYDILHGVITNPHLNYSIGSPQNPTKEFQISFIATTTGTSLDGVLIIPA